MSWTMINFVKNFGRKSLGSHIRVLIYGAILGSLLPAVVT